MGKKKHPEHVNHERWLVSYADLLTLLFAFFVVLFASSVSDKKKAAKMATAMKSAFQESGIFDPHAATPPLADGAGTSQGNPSPIEMPIETPEARGNKDGAGGGDATRHAMERSLAPAVQQHMVTMRSADDGLTLSLDSAGFFPSGSADVRPAVLPLLALIAASLPQAPLRVEGHTDNQLIHTAQYRSNWELSTARAAAIAAVLMRESNVAPEHFSIAGYAEFHPVADNSTEAGRGMNRRVDVVLIRSKPESASATAANAPQHLPGRTPAADTETQNSATLTKSVGVPPLPTSVRRNR